MWCLIARPFCLARISFRDWFLICGRVRRGFTTRDPTYPDPAQPSPVRPGSARPWRPSLPPCTRPSLSLPFSHSIFPRSNSLSSTSLSPTSCPRCFGDGYRRILDPRGELSHPLSLSPSPFLLPSPCAPLSSSHACRGGSLRARPAATAPSPMAPRPLAVAPRLPPATPPLPVRALGGGPAVSRCRAPRQPCPPLRSRRPPVAVASPAVAHSPDVSRPAPWPRAPCGSRPLVVVPSLAAPRPPAAPPCPSPRPLVAPHASLAGPAPP
jgi:hypothetical protein